MKTMITTISPLQDDFHRDLYWMKIIFQSDDKKQLSAVLICVSYEFLWDQFKTREFSKKQLQQWQHEIVQKWTAKGESVFDNKVYFEVFATNEDGRINGEYFLRSKLASA